MENPLNDGDPFNCYFDYDASGNNTIDFGFYDPDFISSTEDGLQDNPWLSIYPNPVGDELVIEGKLSGYRIELVDAVGRLISSVRASTTLHYMDVSSLSEGLYLIRIVDRQSQEVQTQKIIKQ